MLRTHVFYWNFHQLIAYSSQFGLKNVLDPIQLTLKVPEKLQLYGLYVVHICNFGMLRVKR